MAWCLVTHRDNVTFFFTFLEGLSNKVASYAMDIKFSYPRS